MTAFVRISIWDCAGTGTGIVEVTGVVGITGSWITGSWVTTGGFLGGGIPLKILFRILFSVILYFFGLEVEEMTFLQGTIISPSAIATQFWVIKFAT